MENLQYILNKPFVKIGFLLGGGYVLAQYLFYFGGRSVIFNSNFDSAIQFLTILGLYFGLSYCRKWNPKASFWKLLLWGTVIMAISVSIRTIFSILLYTVFAPELGNTCQEMFVEQINAAFEKLQTAPKEQYESLTRAMLTPFSIPIFEGLGLLFLGTMFSIFIAAVQNMFKK